MWPGFRWLFMHDALGWGAYIWRRWRQGARGTVAVEYAVIIVTLSGGLILAFTGMGERQPFRLAFLPV